jgi:enamine deaminase RidA (YjgF/YER057c/UK114 family)
MTTSASASASASETAAATETMTHEAVVVPTWPKPKGYQNGIVAEGRYLAIAGQIGWDASGKFPSSALLDQFARALDNVLAVVAAAGGRPVDIVQMTVFVTDMPAYRACLRDLGPVWRARFGRHFPTMALLGVTALVEPEAKVEVVATAVLPPRP